MGRVSWLAQAEDGSLHYGPSMEVPGTARELVLPPIVLTTTVSIRGTIADADGNPVSQAILTVSRAGDPDDTTCGMTQCDPRGRYVLSGLPPGRLDVSLLGVPGWFPVNREVVVREGRSEDFRLEAGCEIAGRVVDAKGLPCAGLSVSVDLGMASALTDAEGRFRIRGLPACAHNVKVDDRPGTLRRDVPPNTMDLTIVLPVE